MEASRGRRRGFTLFELSVSLGILSLVLGSIFTILIQSERLFNEQLRQFTFDQTRQRIHDRISDELLSAYPPTIFPAALADSGAIRFRKVTGFSAGSVELGPETALSFEMVPGELDNNIDDNGDGLADEGFMTLAEEGDPPLRIAGNLLGLRFNPTTSGLSFSIDLGMVNRDGTAVIRSFNREIHFRNPR